MAFNIYNRKMDNQNFGLGQRKLDRALDAANGMRKISFETRDSQRSELKDCAKFLKESGIRDLRDVKREHLQAYAANLIERLEDPDNTKIGAAGTVQNYISAANRAMAAARLDEKCTVHGVSDAGAPPRSGISEVDHSTSQSDHDAAKVMVSDRLAIQLDLQRALGLRMKESCLINVREVLETAKVTKHFQIESGTKGGLPRMVKAEYQSQYEILERAAVIQGDHTSLTPAHLSFAQYQNQCYREIAKTAIKFHGGRHHFACDCYYNEGGIECPVRAGVEHDKHHQYIAEKMEVSVKEARQLDHEWRMKVSVQLGHGRIDITNFYLG